MLTVAEMLRKKGVVGKFVEFYGTGLSSLSLPDRATIANMAPGIRRDHGIFSRRRGDASLSAFHGPHSRAVRWSKTYAKEQGIFRTDATPDPIYSDTLELDLGTVEPTLAGPKRPAGPRAFARKQKAFRLRSPS